MKPASRFLLPLVAAALSVIALTGCTHLAPAPPPAPNVVAYTLISPWHASPVTLTETPYDCGSPEPIGPDLTAPKVIGNSSPRISEPVRQAVYAESGQAIEDLTHRVWNAALKLRDTGSQAAGRCVISLLTSAAGDHAMDGYMSSSGAWREQDRALLSISIAYLRVRGSLRAANALAPDDNSLIAAWLDDIATRERQYVEGGPCGKGICPLHSHTGLVIASATAAAAVVADDHALFHWAISEYRTAVSGIDERGMLHYDTHGKFALKDNIVSTAALVQIAELGEVNGEPLYTFDDGRIHLLVHTVARGLVDSSPYADATHNKQTIGPTITPWQISWASTYNRRFPDPVLTTLLQQVGHDADMWRGTPWGELA